MEVPQPRMHAPKRRIYSCVRSAWKDMARLLNLYTPGARALPVCMRGLEERFFRIRCAKGWTNGCICFSICLNPLERDMW
jgi:hypothetical protein